MLFRNPIIYIIYEKFIIILDIIIFFCDIKLENNFLLSTLFFIH